MARNHWDELVDVFLECGSSSHSLDNELIAVPAILRSLDQLGTPKGARILDFGCGTGGLCAKMHHCGYRVIGTDSSPKMIVAARRHYPSLTFSLSGDLGCGATFDTVVSSMVLQFVHNLEETIALISRLHKPGGHLLFLVHSPLYVAACLAERAGLFSGFGAGVPGKGTIHIARRAVPICIRTAEQFVELLSHEGSYELAELACYLPFTPEFLCRFPDTPAKGTPKFLMMAFRRA